MLGVMMTYDVSAIRRQFPALAEGAAHFDGPGGSQTPRSVAEAVAGAMTSAVANRGTVTIAERRADHIVTEARAAIGDLLGSPAGGVVFARSMTSLTYNMAQALAKTWRMAHEVVVTRLDHDANIRPWVLAARSTGSVVRLVDFDPRTGDLPVENVIEAMSERTRLLAITGASNLIGTRPDLPEIIAAAHHFGAMVYVDGVHLVPHGCVDVSELDADFFVCSPYKFYGPHLGVLAASPEVLESVQSDRLVVGIDHGPERMEMGTLPYEQLAGVTAAVDFLAGLGPGDGDRRDALRRAYAAIEEHETRMLARLVDGLDAIGGVRRHGRPSRRTPTVLFSIDGHSPADVHRALADVGVNAPGGTFYAPECARVLGLGEDGANRAGINLYTDESDVDRLLAAVRDLAAR
jgi:cysteine desulfurase family protein (TIGR01976 family)